MAGSTQSKKVRGTELFINKNPDGFSFTVGDMWYRTYHVYPHPKEQESFVVEIDEEPEQFWYIWARKFKYSDFGVNSLDKLIDKFIENPDVTLYKITGLRRHILKVYIDDNEIPVKPRNSNGLIADVSFENIGDEEADEDGWHSIYDDDYELEERKKWILEVEKYYNGFRFRIVNDPGGRSWLIEQDPRDTESFILSFEEYGENVVSVTRSYCSYGNAQNICELFAEFMRDPFRYARFLSSDTIPTLNFEEVKVINKSKYQGYDFEGCKYTKNKEEEEIKILRRRLREIYAKMEVKSFQVFDERGRYKLISQLPRAFSIDGVNISLTKFVKSIECKRSNCALIRIGDESRDHVEEGVYFVYSEPYSTIPISPKEAEEVFKDLRKLREKIKDVIQNKPDQELLVVYDNGSIEIYEEYEKSQIIKFYEENLKVKMGQLNVYNVPILPIIDDDIIRFEETSEIEIEKFKVEFSEPIIRFKINPVGGKAELVFNPLNDVTVIAKIEANKEEVIDGETLSVTNVKYLEMEPGNLYLFVVRK
ncbi:MAG: hypothetical protein JHC26_11685 [Thermofilum sp.]|jgi:hypothetical protein|uniref:hypothetical protein n=1 Tax=Thermofilum sp. TaxID=1961369 RepID=UPI002582F657|nr:hypothetical protein [Thermofilum sp.]MCI4409744.1 hypothetical protein [Thermofilum sp.]